MVPVSRRAVFRCQVSGVRVKNLGIANLGITGFKKKINSEF
jgi:hypothetical protein